LHLGSARGNGTADSSFREELELSAAPVGIDPQHSAPGRQQRRVQCEAQALVRVERQLVCVLAKEVFDLRYVIDPR